MLEMMDAARAGGGDHDGFHGSVWDLDRVRSGGIGHGRSHCGGQVEKDWILVIKRGKLIKERSNMKEHEIINAFVRPYLKDELLNIIHAHKQPRAERMTRIEAAMPKTYACFATDLWKESPFQKFTDYLARNHNLDKGVDWHPMNQPLLTAMSGTLPLQDITVKSNFVQGLLLLFVGSKSIHTRQKLETTKMAAGSWTGFYCDCRHVSSLRILLLMAGIEGNPGPKSYFTFKVFPGVNNLYTIIVIYRNQQNNQIELLSSSPHSTPKDMKIPLGPVLRWTKLTRNGLV